MSDLRGMLVQDGDLIVIHPLADSDFIDSKLYLRSNLILQQSIPGGIVHPGSIKLRQLGEAESDVKYKPVAIHQNSKYSPDETEYNSRRDIPWVVCTYVNPCETDQGSHSKKD